MIARLCLAWALFLVSGVSGLYALPPTYALSGVVVDSETHEPLPATEVQVSPAGKSDLVESVTTGVNGWFTFDNLFAGKYILTAARPGYLQSHYEQHGGYSTAIKTGPGLPSSHLLFSLAKKASITGVITDQDGEPVPYATVHALKRSVVDGLHCITSAGSAATSEDGRYRVSNLTAGTYFLVVMAQPWYTQQYMAMEQRVDVTADSSSTLDAAYPVTYYPGVFSDTAAEPLALHAGAQLDVNFTLTAAPAVHVVVPRSAGSNTNARLLAANEWGVALPLRSMYFSRQGQIFTVAAGRYRLVAGWRDARGSHSANKIVTVEGNLTINPSTLDSRRSLAAAITDPATGIHLSARDLALKDLSTLQVLQPIRSIDKQARWRAQELTGSRYELVWNGPDDFYVDGLTAVNGKVTGNIVEFGPDDAVQVQVRLRRGAALVSGVVERQGTPVSGAMVLLLRDDFATAPSLIRRYQSDSDGRFVLDHVAPGSYTLLALPASDDLAYADSSVMRPYLSRGKKLSISPATRYRETIELSEH